MTRARYERTATLTLPLGCVAYRTAVPNDHAELFEHRPTGTEYIAPLRQHRPSRSGNAGLCNHELVALPWHEQNGHAILDGHPQALPLPMRNGHRRLTGIYERPGTGHKYVAYLCTLCDETTGRLDAKGWRRDSGKSCPACAKAARGSDHQYALGLHGGAAKAARVDPATLPLLGVGRGMA